MRLWAMAAFALALTACSAGGGVPVANNKPDGKYIFNNAAKGNCIACHRVTAEKYVGPGLAGSGTRHSRPWLEKWLTDPQKVWEENDTETAEMRKRLAADSRKYTAMKVLRPLEDADRVALIDYLMTL